MGTVLLFPFQFAFHFSGLTALVGPANAVLKGGGNRGCPCLAPEPLGKIFSSTPLSDVCSGSDLCGLHYAEVHSLYSFFVGSFYCELMLTFIRCVFCIFWGDHKIPNSDFAHVVEDMDLDAERSLPSWRKSHLIMTEDPLGRLMDMVCYYLVGNVCICAHQGRWGSHFFACDILIRFVDQGNAGLVRCVHKRSLPV